MKKQLLPMNTFAVAEVELVYKTKVKPCDRPQITSTNDAYSLLIREWDKNKLELQEQFKVMLLNRNNRVLGIYETSTGSTSNIVVDPKLIFVTAIKAHASALILAHNHPSGEITPSKQDIALTKKLKLAGKLLNISVLDHLIITAASYLSLAEQRLM